MNIETYCTQCDDHTKHVKKEENHHFKISRLALREAWKCIECGTYSLLNATKQISDLSRQVIRS